VSVRRLRDLVAILLAAALAAAAAASEAVVPAEPGALARAIAETEPGAVLRLAPGVHQGPVVLEQPVTLEGGGKAAIDAGGAGSVVTISGSDVVVRGIEIRGSGSSHETMDAGVKLMKTAQRPVVEYNRILGNLIGVHVWGATESVVRGNTIVGRTGARMNSRGNGVYVWNATGTVVEGNDVSLGRDGIFSNVSRKGAYRNNFFHDLRFAVHYMYTHDSEVSGNISIGNHLGYALMYSNNINVHDNLSLRDREHGVMMNYTNASKIRGNLVRGGTHQKCTFIFNAHKNAFAGNHFENCGIGIHFTAGSERNVITGNAFIGNRTQVMYVGTRFVEWSDGARGNFWSDHPAFDLDGDGIADSIYRPNDLMDHILWSQPAAKLLLGSPAVQLVRWSQAAFPAILPGGVTDSHPLMQPVEIPVPERIAALETAARPDWMHSEAMDADPDTLAGH
jgi:nitrous oxidase accessory protein